LDPKKKRHTEQEHDNEERWLLTYADLITLLMAFFIVMFSLSQVDAQKFKALAVSLGDAFDSPGMSMVHVGVGDNGRLALLPRQSRPRHGPQDPNDDSPNRPRYRDLKELKGDFLKMVKENDLEGSVTLGTNAKGDRLIIRLSDKLLFDVGSAELTPPARELMDKVAAILMQAGKRIRIEGHTDNVPVRSGRYASNWQLSTERATNVLMYLVQQHALPPEQLEAGGCGEYRPVATNDTEEGRAKNRRVEFIILDEVEEDAQANAPVLEEEGNASPAASLPLPELLPLGEG
jgi:chemotaxis protein MotB